MTVVARDEDGSVLLLALGYALLAIALIFVCVCATDLYIAQKRVDALADAAALAGADGFTLVIDEGGAARADLTDEGVREEVESLLGEISGEATLREAESPDGVSARVTITAEWRPPLLSLFVPEGVRLEGTGTSRTALR